MSTTTGVLTFLTVLFFCGFIAFGIVWLVGISRHPKVWEWSGWVSLGFGIAFVLFLFAALYYGLRRPAPMMGGATSNTTVTETVTVSAV